MTKNLPIILILMAILVPSMLGYVKKSKEVRTRADEAYTSYSYENEWDD